MRIALLLPVVLACFLPATSRAAAPASPGRLCLRAIAAAERGGALPPRLLDAIALVETGRPDPRTGVVQPWPWTINAGGIARYFDSKAEAVAAARALQAAGTQSVDVGCMQINLMYHPHAFASLDQAFDPQANAVYAARFLQALFAESRSWPVAAADYHSQTPDIGADYARRVLALWPEGALQAGAPALARAGAWPHGPVAVMLPPDNAPIRVLPLAAALGGRS
ncbi:MAG TPA: hypothetical protein VME92_21055 [Acetobacteraceae bacterium]|nr:hypothetical protein [Acetobacteraceae bacterium]